MVTRFFERMDIVVQQVVDVRRYQRKDDIGAFHVPFKESLSGFCQDVHSFKMHGIRAGSMALFIFRKRLFDHIRIKDKGAHLFAVRIYHTCRFSGSGKAKHELHLILFFQLAVINIMMLVVFIDAFRAGSAVRQEVVQDLLTQLLPLGGVDVGCISVQLFVIGCQRIQLFYDRVFFQLFQGGIVACDDPFIQFSCFVSLDHQMLRRNIPGDGNDFRDLSLFSCFFSRLLCSFFYSFLCCRFFCGFFCKYGYDRGESQAERQTQDQTFSLHVNSSFKK